MLQRNIDVALQQEVAYIVDGIGRDWSGMTIRHAGSGLGQRRRSGRLVKIDAAACDQTDRKVNAMSDVSASKPKAKASAELEMPKFEIPRFEMPKFDMPKFEVPAAFRELAEKSVSQCKDNWEKRKPA